MFLSPGQRWTTMGRAVRGGVGGLGMEVGERGLNVEGGGGWKTFRHHGTLMTG